MANENPVLCPSSRVDQPSAAVFAVVSATAADATAIYLEESQAVTPELLSLVAPASAAEVLRVASPCAQKQCAHFDSPGDRCRLATKVVRWMPVAVEKLPRCAIRPSCRWWQQEGAQACKRCPLVITDSVAQGSADVLKAIADPQQD